LASSIDQLYGDLWGRSASRLSEDVGRSLSPRSADCLYDAFARCGVGPEHVVLDAGSRDAGHAIELAKRFGCRSVALDPVSLHREYMKKAIAEADLGDRVTATQGAIEALPFKDASMDAIWCRDVLNHVDLPRGFAECVRVLKPGGSMLIYVTLATDRCEPREAARLWEALAIIPANMERGYFERCARSAGFEIAMVDRIDSEWREHAIESGDQWGELKALLQIARMRRREQELVERHGRNAYEAAYAGELWGIYQLLGKLCPMVYRLQKG
jgi:ubiquinone/menaquinone biosynthesis C-methylase UbiE